MNLGWDFFFFTILHLDIDIVKSVTPPTYCNPMDLGYRFRLEHPSSREAADPVMVIFKNDYFLFASKSGGYWYSSDRMHWNLIEPTGLPLEDYAPTVIVINNIMYFTAFDSAAIYKTKDPIEGIWFQVAKIGKYADPALFVDDDGKVYMYDGSSELGDIYVQQLDPNNGWHVVGESMVAAWPNYLHRGWEIGGENNEGILPWIEGAWMTKHNGIYFLQYAAPGTQWKTYADGVFTATNPLGPFTYAPYSPFSHKPTGFLGGAGHGNTFKDINGSLWHITTSSISVKRKFERRISLFPSKFTVSEQLVTDTYLGDYPKFISPVGESTTPGWMLLSYKKSAQASSTLSGYGVANAFNEDIRSWWSAKTGKAGEWLMVDLGKKCKLHAIQINFADQDTSILGRMHDTYCWYIEVKLDEKQWETIINRHSNSRDAPHEYVQLDQPIQVQSLRITNVHTPGGPDAKFSISGFRIFGNGLGSVPEEVTGITVHCSMDRRHVQIAWEDSPNADFYIVRYGVTNDIEQLYNNYQVYDTVVLIPSLTDNVTYYFTVDAINENGIVKGTIISELCINQEQQTKNVWVRYIIIIVSILILLASICSIVKPMICPTKTRRAPAQYTKLFQLTQSKPN